MKICSHCKIEKSSDSFNKDKSRIDKLQRICRICYKSIHHEWLINNRQKHNKRVALYREKHPWASTLAYIIQRCTNRKHNKYKWYGGKGIKCLITSKELKQLWFRDKAYEMKEPSIDRIESDKNYTFENCQYMELKENRRKGL